MAEVKIGCCGFAGRRETYFRKYPVIEVEQTFYDPPRVFTGEKWRKEAPDNFEFVVKAWQLITHPATSPTYRRMQVRLSRAELQAAGHFQPTDVVWTAWQRTREIAQAMRARTIVFECPETFAPTPEHKDNLRQFVGRVQKESNPSSSAWFLAWNPPKDWPEADILELSDELDLVQVVDPFVKPPPGNGACYLRLNGIRGYRHHYSDEELEQLKEQVCRFKDGYCLFNTLHMRHEAGRLSWMLRAPKPEPAAETEPAAQTAPKPAPAQCVDAS